MLKRVDSHLRLLERTALVVGGGVYRHCVGPSEDASEGEPYD
jgi:hypothetical protein